YQSQDLTIRQHEFASLDISGEATRPNPMALPPTAVSGAKVEKLAGGFFNISGGTAHAQGNFYFVDAHWQRIYRWDTSSRQIITVSDAPLEPVNLAAD